MGMWPFLMTSVYGNLYTLMILMLKEQGQKITGNGNIFLQNLRINADLIILLLMKTHL